MSPGPSRRRWFLHVHVLLLGGLAATAGCKGADADKREDRVVVFAAASLRDAFTALAPTFKKAHPGVEVTYNFAGTQELRTQLEHGAAVDVFASADQKHMGELVNALRAVNPIVFARNEPVVVVAREAWRGRAHVRCLHGDILPSDLR